MPRICEAGSSCFPDYSTKHQAFLKSSEVPCWGALNLDPEELVLPRFYTLTSVFERVGEFTAYKLPTGTEDTLQQFSVENENDGGQKRQSH